VAPDSGILAHKIGGLEMSVSNHRRESDFLIDAIEFLSMTKNLKDDNTFYVWIGKLFQFDKGMTIRYMKFNESKFQRLENRALYNNLLSLNNLSRFQI